MDTIATIKEITGILFDTFHSPWESYLIAKDLNKLFSFVIT